MAKEKLTPDRKSMPSDMGVKDGGKSILTTPKIDTNGRYNGGKDVKGSIMK